MILTIDAGPDWTVNRIRAKHAAKASREQARDLTVVVWTSGAAAAADTFDAIGWPWMALLAAIFAVLAVTAWRRRRRYRNVAATWQAIAAYCEARADGQPWWRAPEGATR